MTTEPQHEPHSRNPLAAAILSLLVPGLGQIYNGQLVLGLILGACSPQFPVLLVLAAYMRLFEQPYVGIVVIIVSLLVVPLAVGQAFIKALGQKQFVPRFFNHWSVYISFALVALLVHVSVRNVDRFVDALGYEVISLSEESMEPTLLIKDYIILDRKAYSSKKPERGDIVAYGRRNDPSTGVNEEALRIVRRVIGVPGDQVEIRGTRVYVNGKKLDEIYAVWSADGRGKEFGPVRVPPGKLFVLSDNRDQLDGRGLVNDSRDYYDTFVEMSRVWGQVQYVYLSISRPDRTGRWVE